MMVAMRGLALLLLLAVCATAAGGVAAAPAPVVLPPPPNAACSTCPAAVLLWAPGASIPPSAYAPPLTQLQLRLAAGAAAASRPRRLYVAVADCVADLCFENGLPDGFGLRSALETALAAVNASGDVPAGAALFVGAHSLGGGELQALVPSLVKEEEEESNLSPSSSSAAGLALRDVAGQVLTGSFLRRASRGKYFAGEGVPTLTLGGELDGLCRSTRMAEGWYHAAKAVGASRATLEFPTLVLRGFDHMSFASGQPPELVRLFDLRADKNDTVAHAEFAAVAGDFLASLTVAGTAWKGDAVAASRVAAGVKASTAEFVDPVIAMMELEGSRYLKPWCQTLSASVAAAEKTADCWVGSPYVDTVAAPRMASVLPARTKNTDQFHDVYDIDPVHLPSIDKVEGCEFGATPACHVTTTSVTQAVYSWGSSLIEDDTGFFPQGATEMRSKFNSRQAVWIAANRTPADFEETDAHTNICAQVNAVAWAEAWSVAPEGARARFSSVGEPLDFSRPDIKANSGPTWIWDPLHFDRGKRASDGATVTFVESVFMATPYEYFIQEAARKHYCKFLSPAYALEWLTIDGLRLRLSESGEIPKAKK